MKNGIVNLWKRDNVFKGSTISIGLFIIALIVFMSYITVKGL
jgi:hypothetical protein